MIPERHLQVLRKIVANLEDKQIQWTLTGSLGMALQGMPLEVHDIDLQTDNAGAFEIERVFKDAVVSPVSIRESTRMRSYFGKLEIDGIQVEVMGDIQRSSDGQTWEEPVKFQNYCQWLDFEGMKVPVLSLYYEYQAYLKMGRTERAEMLRQWLEKSK